MSLNNKIILPVALAAGLMGCMDPRDRVYEGDDLRDGGVTDQADAAKSDGEMPAQTDAVPADADSVIQPDSSLPNVPESPCDLENGGVIPGVNLIRLATRIGVVIENGHLVDGDSDECGSRSFELDGWSSCCNSQDAFSYEDISRNYYGFCETRNVNEEPIKSRTLIYSEDADGTDMFINGHFPTQDLFLDEVGHLRRNENGGFTAVLCSKHDGEMIPDCEMIPVSPECEEYAGTVFDWLKAKLSGFIRRSGV